MDLDLSSCVSVPFVMGKMRKFDQRINNIDICYVMTCYFGKKMVTIRKRKMHLRRTRLSES